MIKRIKADFSSVTVVVAEETREEIPGSKIAVQLYSKPFTTSSQEDATLKFQFWVPVLAEEVEKTLTMESLDWFWMKYKDKIEYD